MMKRFGCLYFDVIVLMGNCLHATHHRNAFSSPFFFFFLKKVSKAEGGLVAMDIWNFMFTFEEVSWNLRYLVSTWVAFTFRNYKIVIGYLELKDVAEHWQSIKTWLAFNIRIMQPVFVGCPWSLHSPAMCFWCKKKYLKRKHNTGQLVLIYCRGWLLRELFRVGFCPSVLCPLALQALGCHTLMCPRELIREQSLGRKIASWDVYWEELRKVCQIRVLLL